MWIYDFHFYPFVVHKAYRAISKITHPDHNDEPINATEKFQVLGMVHDLLSCDEKRKLYDETGEVGVPAVITVSDEDYQNCKKSFEGKCKGYYFT